MRRQTAGVHPALRHARGVDARRVAGQQCCTTGRWVPRPPSRGPSTSSSHRHATWAPTSTSPASRASRAWSPAGCRRSTAQPVAGAKVDVWQANADGFYDVQQPARWAWATCAGCSPPTPTAPSGSGRSCPAHYPIPADGPVGACCAATGRHEWRPAHIHFEVSAPGSAHGDHPRLRRGQPLPGVRRRVRGQGESLIRDFAGSTTRPRPRRTAWRTRSAPWSSWSPWTLSRRRDRPRDHRVPGPARPGVAARGARRGRPDRRLPGAAGLHGLGGRRGR